MKKFNKKQMDILKENFNVSEDDETIELETWTDGGVDMFITIYKDDNDYMQQLINYYDNFDIDEEIELHRQDERYRKEFTITQSIADFTNYEKFIEDIIIKLNK